MRSLAFVALAALISCALSAQIPQVPLCDWEGCPTVSRIGLGTLHLGDKIGGLSDPAKINEWLTTGMNLVSVA